METIVHISFYHAKGRANSYGLAPITCRIIVDRRASDISTKIFIGPSQWKDNRVIGESEDILRINLLHRLSKNCMLSHKNWNQERRN